MPGGTAALLHDRHWHMFWEDPKLIVMKRLSGGAGHSPVQSHAGSPAPGRDATRTRPSSATTSAAV